MLLCAPHSYRPTTHQDTRTPTSQPHQTRRPSSQQGAPYLSDPPPGAGLIPLETSLLALPGQRCTLLDSKGSPGCTFAPGHAPELGSSSSCSGGSAVGLPACLGFTSRSWSRARFFSWGRHRKGGARHHPTLREREKHSQRQAEGALRHCGPGPEEEPFPAGLLLSPPGRAQPPGRQRRLSLWAQEREPVRAS